jgi:hypothetical protein
MATFILKKTAELRENSWKDFFVNRKVSIGSFELESIFDDAPAVKKEALYSIECLEELKQNDIKKRSNHNAEFEL